VEQEKSTGTGENRQDLKRQAFAGPFRGLFFTYLYFYVQK
jgi:hypothetical protein